MAWTTKMFIVSVIGSFAALMWPILVALYKKKSADIYKMLSIGGGARSDGGFIAYSAILVIGGILGFLILAFVISAIAAAVGFAAFLQDDQKRVAIQNLGSVAYFVAFSYGFSAASLVGEPLKKN